MTIRQKQSTEREIKALTIVGLQDQIKRISGRQYEVKSQSSDTWYDVISSNDGQSCSCPDHVFRHVECKHLKAVSISRHLRNKIVNNSDINEIENQNDLVCKCGSIQVIKIGIHHNKSGSIPRFKCKSCAHKWSDNLGFANNRVNSKIITMAIDLYFKGVSLRKIKEHVVMFHGVKVSHVTILGWIRKFGEVVAPYVDQFKPELSGVYHVDEMMIHVRKEENKKVIILGCGT